MPQPDAQLLALSLALTPGIGGRSITRVLTRNSLLNRSVAEFCRLGVESLIEEYHLTRTGAERWTRDIPSMVDRAKALKDRLDQMGVAFVTAADQGYPHTVERLDAHAPGVLYLYGNRRLLDSKTFAVLGSRNAPDAALAAIESLAEEGVLNGEVLVGGHNTPEYQRASVVPLRYGAPRILGLDRELFDALGDDLSEEPFRAARLWRYQFDPLTDLAVTTIHPDQKPHAGANRQRDWLIAGLAQRLDLTWVARGGNMERIGRAAARAGRPVRVLDLFPGALDWGRYGATVIPQS